MQYKKVTVVLTPYDETASDIVMAQMGELGFDSFEETEGGFIGYAQISNYTEGTLATLSTYVEGVSMTIEEDIIEDQDWNKEWEENYFKPIVIGGKCRIRSPFHEADPSMQYEIIINPQMSFGTGYHETTTMMMEYLMEKDITGKSVLDMGCGTGILGIMAIMRGAQAVDCVDIDEWCYNNTLENISLNSLNGITTILGGAEVLGKEPKYDLVVANINRNILTRDMHLYAQTLKPGAQMMLSGFYSEDADIVLKEAQRFGLSLVEKKVMNNWNGLFLQKD
ncbi:MAG: 50S ribosomal protein L11 methyltransferase [Bacteroidales bacterium]|nr:50S ribosomal protein L11 methyltransferase [Bacteroidales bacterium]